jgi:hypothetical protein
MEGDVTKRERQEGQITFLILVKTGPVPNESIRQYYNIILVMLNIEIREAYC